MSAGGVEWSGGGGGVRLCIKKKGDRIEGERKSNEHIDLMWLIVVQLISPLAPVRKIKGSATE